MSEIWTYHAALETSRDITGYEIAASDGSIGKIDAATYETESSYVVVSTGPWIFGRNVLLPARVIERIDHDEKVVYVALTKDEIKAAPELDDAWESDEETYVKPTGDYYASLRSWD